MEGLPFTYDISGNNNNNGWGNWGGALIGGAIGAAFGAGWNRNNNGCCNTQCCGNNAAWGQQFIMDNLTTMRTDVNSIGRDQLLQTNQLSNHLCEGFGTLSNAVNGVGADLARGQARTEAAVYTTGLQGQIQQKDNVIAQLNATHNSEVQAMRSSFDMLSSQKDCCCETNRNIEQQGCATRELIQSEMCATRNAIHQEGEATRALVAKIERDELLRQNAAQAAKIGQLECQQFTTAALAVQNQQFNAQLGAMQSNLINHMVTIRNNATTAAGATTPAA